jgi:hypothetical protein
MKGTAAAASAAALVLLAGCGGSGGGGPEPSPGGSHGGTSGKHTDGPDDGGASGGETGSGGSGGGADAGATGGGGGGGDLEPENLSGGWTTDPGGTSGKVVFLIVSGKKAIVATGTGSCTGSVARDADPVTFDLTCQGGAEGYTQGAVKSHRGKKLVVSWDSGRTSHFVKGGGPDQFPTPKS